MSDEAPEPVSRQLDILEAVHDQGTHLVALAEHDAADLLRRKLADGPVDADTLERFQELLTMPGDFESIMARHARP